MTEKSLGRSYVRAFEDEGCDYYKLTQSLGELLPAGAIFYHDKSDHVRGSISEGCLKLCRTPEGSTYGPLAGDPVVFHTYYIKTDLFELVYKGTDSRNNRRNQEGD